MTLDGPLLGNIICVEDGPIDDVTNARLSSLVSVLGGFKLDHLQPFELTLSQKIFNFFTFILGGPFLLPQRANYGKGGFIQLLN